jgi:hypothetical protein
MIEGTDVHLPQCQCPGCSSEKHAGAGRCGAKAGGTGTQFCASCEKARVEDAKRFSQTLDPSGDAGNPAA